MRSAIRSIIVVSWSVSLSVLSAFGPRVWVTPPGFKVERSWEPRWPMGRDFRAALKAVRMLCSSGKTVKEPIQTVMLEKSWTTVSPMSLIRIVRVGTASKDHRMKKALLEFDNGVKSP